MVRGAMHCSNNHTHNRMGGHKAAKKFAPKLKEIIKKRHAEKSKRKGMKQKAEHKERMQHKRAMEELNQKNKYNPRTDFDLGTAVCPNSILSQCRIFNKKPTRCEHSRLNGCSS